jgi:hypothetical protein
MARISGQAQTRLIEQGYMNPAKAWTNESQFGASDPNTGRWQWNDQGLNCTVFELLNYAEVHYASTMTSLGINVSPDQTTTVPTYFKYAYFAGEQTNPTAYGGLVP